MFSKYKGKFGYLKGQPVRIGLFTLAMLILCAGIFMAGFFIKGSSKNIFTVVAVLGMLPVAKMIVSLIMYFKAENHSCDKDTYDKIEKSVEGKDVCYGYDFYMTSYKIDFPVKSAVVFDDSLICYMEKCKADSKDLKEHIEKYMANNSITGYKTYVLDNIEKYCDRLKSVSSDYAKTDSDIQVISLVKSLTL